VKVEAAGLQSDTLMISTKAAADGVLKLRLWLLDLCLAGVRWQVPVFLGARHAGQIPRLHGMQYPKQRKQEAG
jgi:hypothetical protein